MKYLFMPVITFVLICTLAYDGVPRPARSLRAIADERRLLIGACVSTRHLQANEDYRATLANEFNSIVAENDMKFHRLQPRKGEFAFGNADRLVAFAKENDMSVRGHTLMWHDSVPAWLKETAWSKEELREILKTHIETVLERYKGKIFAWDVVNEAITDEGEWRESIWYDTLGEDFLFDAFRWARETDPNTKLFYNDYSAEPVNTKSDRIYALVQDMKENGVPIDGVGFQLHIRAEDELDVESIRENIRRLANLGLEVHFTEVDVRIRKPVTEEKLALQAQRYRELMELFLSEPNCTAFLTWGVSDRYSWIPGHFEGYDDALLFDRAFLPKPAYEALYQSIEQN